MGATRLPTFEQDVSVPAAVRIDANTGPCCFVQWVAGPGFGCHECIDS
jgi:hypothetical protein